MLVKYDVNHRTRKVKVKKDKLNGSRFTVDLAVEIFDLEDKGFTIECSSNAVRKKLHNFRVACWRNNK